MQTAIAKIGNDNYLRHLDTNPAPCKDSESAYTEFVNTLQQLGVSAIYHDVSQHDINILEVPDTQLLDGPSPTSIFAQTSGGKSTLITQVQIDERLNNSHPPKA